MGHNTAQLLANLAMETADMGGSRVYESAYIMEPEIAEYLDTLRNSGVRLLVVENQSTGLMSLIHSIIHNGGTFAGVSTYGDKRGIEFLI